VDESRLRSLGADVESKVDLPDFGAVAERGARIRRRRTAATGAVVALAVAVTAFTLTRTFDTNRSQQPIHQPAPTIDPEAARREARRGWVMLTGIFVFGGILVALAALLT